MRRNGEASGFGPELEEAARWMRGSIMSAQSGLCVAMDNQRYWPLRKGIAVGVTRW